MMIHEPVRYTVRIHDDADGRWAEVVELPGCFATGETDAELWAGIAESVGEYLSTETSTVKATLADVVADGPVTEERRSFELVTC